MQYRVGCLGGMALEPTLRGIVPVSRWHSFDTAVVGQGLFQALRDDAVDVAVCNKNFFSEERCHHELFDLKIVQTLTEFPRT